MVDQPSVQDWFIAALLHDLGKTLISERGWWDNHADLRNARSGDVKFADLLTSELIDRINTHEARDENRKSRKFPRDTNEESALVMADQLQKAMYESRTQNGGMLERLVSDTFESAHLNPPFFPYYGQPITWNQERAQKLATEIALLIQNWNKQPKLSNVLTLEKKLVHSPHTTNIPHNSLAFHHRFTALFFYLIYRQLSRLASIYDWQKLDFSIATIKPDPLNLFYRLKDVKAHETIVREHLRNKVFERLFKSYLSDLPQITVTTNPFEFFGRDAQVVVVEDSNVLLDTLQLILNEDSSESLRHLTVDITQFSIAAPDKWKSEHRWDYVPPRNVTHRIEEHELFSSHAMYFQPSVTPRCVRCGQPLDLVKAVNGIQCQPCNDLLERTAGVGHAIENLLGEEQRRGFIFLNLAPLENEAQVRAEDFFNAFKIDKQRFGKPRSNAKPEDIAQVMNCLTPTPTGIFEYLQAVMEIAEFQQDVLSQSSNVFPLVQFPTLMIWVTNESHYWDFIIDLSQKLEQLHLTHALSGLLCHPSTPFWSLMDRLTMFTKQEGVYNRGEFYDLSGGEIMIFTDAEVKAIRDLAQSVRGDMAFKSQLNALVQLARVATLRELEMEIDERDNLHKLRSDFCGELKSALNRMTGDDQRSRDKRALFIKNIVRLAGFQKDRGQQPRTEGRR